MTNTHTITLPRAITVADKPVTKLTLREPTGSDLRGIMITPVLQGSTPAIAKLVSRVATPGLTEEQIIAMPYANQVALMAGLNHFLDDGTATSPAAEMSGETAH